MKPIILRQHEVIHLRDHGSVIAWRVVKPSWIAAAQAAGESDGPQPGDKYWVEICPHGRTGEEGWVKEKHAFYSMNYQDLGTWHPVDRDVCCHYCAGCPIDLDDKIDRWWPSAIMPRWASRFTVALDVGVKRIQEVTEEEAVQSGIEKRDTKWGDLFWKVYVKTPCEGEDGEIVGFKSAIRSFRSLNESIHGKGSWDRNDYFWKITCTLKK